MIETAGRFFRCVCGRGAANSMNQPPLGYVVFDLDGTLLRSNSFHLWLVFLISDMASPLRIRDRIALLGYIASRAVKFIDHGTLKRLTMTLPGALSSLSAQQFAERYLRPRLSNSCVRELRLHLARGKEVQVILATAAPRCYSDAIAKCLGIAIVVATDFDDNGTFREMLRMKKAEAVRKIATSAPITYAYTDHRDDLELLKLAAIKILVNPTPANLNAIQRALAEEIQILQD